MRLPRINCVAPFIALLAIALGGIASASGIGGGGGAVSVPLNLNLGTTATNTDAVDITATFNSASTTFDAPLFVDCTNTASHSGSLCVDLQIGTFTYFSLGVDGSVNLGSSNGGNVKVWQPMALFFNGNENAAWNTNNITVQNGFVFQWTNSGNPIGSVDTGISRDAADVLDIGNGTQGDKTGTLKLTTESLQGVAVASLPALPAAGMIAYVTDASAVCSAGTTPTGGGSTKCFVGYNGSAWKELGI